MVSIIKFSGDDDNYIRADEEIDSVVGLWRTAKGEPFEVTLNGRRSMVNPAQITCVREVSDRSARVHAL